ncbi:MAG: hypothetical protein JRF38_21030 [Deltaproteobacteria bacterium]|jgi:hypothetical protein|nr:hypothetical protein [Deltaproteobacteria bacterium]
MGIDSDWGSRILCSDGNCIGVIGPDGHCKECGKKYEGTLPTSMVADTQSRSGDDDAPGDGSDSGAQPQPAADASSGAETDDDDWANRQLCSDGNCIGVIGSDGRCKECGKALD